MINKITSYLTPSIYTGKLDYSNQGVGLVLVRPNEGNSTYSWWPSQFGEFDFPTISTDSQSGLNRINKNISNYAKYNYGIGWVANPLSLVYPTTPGGNFTLSANGQQSIYYNSYSGSFAFSVYYYTQSRFIPTSCGFDIELAPGSLVKQLKVSTSFNSETFFLINLQTLTVSTRATTGNIEIKDVVVEQLSTNKYRVKYSFIADRYTGPTDTPIKITPLPLLFNDGTPIDVNSPDYYGFYTLTDEVVTISRYFTYFEVLYLYDYYIEQSSQNFLRLEIEDNNNSCPSAVYGPSLRNIIQDDYYKKEPINQNSNQWLGILNPNQSWIMLSYYAGISGTESTSLVSNEKTGYFSFHNQINLNVGNVYIPDPSYPTGRYILQSVTADQKFFATPLYFPQNPSKAICISFFTKMDTSLGRYIGISPYYDENKNTVFTSPYSKASGPGITNSYFTVIDLLTGQVVSKCTGDEYDEDVDVISVPNSGGYYKIVYRAKAKNPSSNWMYVNPVIAVVNQDSSVPLLDTTNPLLPKLIVELPVVSDYYNDYYIYKQLNTYCPLNSATQNLNISTNSNKFSLIPFVYFNGGFSESDFIQLSFSSLNLNYNDLNVNQSNALLFKKELDGTWNAYYASSGYYNSNSDGNLDLTGYASCNVGVQDFSNVKIISYLSGNNLCVFINGQTYYIDLSNNSNLLFAYNKINNYINSGVSINGYSNHEFFLCTPSLLQILPFLNGVVYNYIFFSNQIKINNMIRFYKNIDSVEVEILKSM